MFDKILNTPHTSIRSKHFGIVSTLSLSGCETATSDNVISMLKQRCVCQRRNLFYSPISKLILNNVRQRQNSVIIFNFDVRDVGKRGNNVGDMTICK